MSGRYHRNSNDDTLPRISVKAKKSLGQHFLNDAAVRDLIIDAAQLSPDDTVLEIGPGLGVLTAQLAKFAGSVVAVELDDRLAEQLKHKYRFSANVHIIHADILTLTPEQILGGTEKSYKIVANLPYYITSPVLHHFIQAHWKPSLMVVMIQKEVAMSIVGQNGKMTALGITMQLYSRQELIAVVPPDSFSPPPAVDSAVVRFAMLREPAVSERMIPFFLQTVRNGFSAPRKQLRNSLAHGMDIPANAAEMLLNTAGIDSRRRAETLSLNEWKTLVHIIQSEEQGDE